VVGKRYIMGVHGNRVEEVVVAWLDGMLVGTREQLVHIWDVCG
jgi:hypothetical protein